MSVGCYCGLQTVTFVFGKRIGVDLLLNIVQATLEGGGGSVTIWGCVFIDTNWIW